jgi:hypothetical protein
MCGAFSSLFPLKCSSTGSCAAAVLKTLPVEKRPRPTVLRTTVRKTRRPLPSPYMRPRTRHSTPRRQPQAHRRSGQTGVQPSSPSYSYPRQQREGWVYSQGKSATPPFSGAGLAPKARASEYNVFLLLANNVLEHRRAYIPPAGLGPVLFTVTMNRSCNWSVRANPCLR